MVLRESDIEAGGRGGVGIITLISRGEACDAELSGELKVESYCILPPPDLDRHPTKAPPIHYAGFLEYDDLTPQVSGCPR